MNFNRTIADSLRRYASKFPVVALLGPRQSGKTFITQQLFSNYKYINLENADVRFAAQQDPRQFLTSFSQEEGVIIDEFQHVPELLSYIQTTVDKEYKPGYFILTGSQNFLLNQHITQSLAGRVGILTLLPFSITELENNKITPATIESLLFNGMYPRIYAQPFTPEELYPAYIQTYIERDVRHITKVEDLHTFQKFLKLCAGSTGQLLNLSSLASDCGISGPTAKAWISILEASYIIFLLQPYYKNFNKRVIKAPKLFFYDTGLAASLLGITSPNELFNHYLRGGLFESFILSDLIKRFYNAGKVPRVYFWRDSHGHEIDCIIEKGEHLIPIEIKSGMTISGDYLKPLHFWQELTDSNEIGYTIYTGPENLQIKDIAIKNWRSINQIEIF